MELIRAQGLSKRFGKEERPALDGVDLAVEAGTITGLAGPDGAGKTTLIRLMAGLLTPSAGELTVLGHSLPEESGAVQESIGYMPQKFGLYEELTVMENLELYADLQGVPKEHRGERIAQLQAFAGLSPFADRLSGRLSGGMKQKLGLACTLMKKPRLLLLDEPGVGVDPLSRRELWAMVRELAAEGAGVVWSTAYLDEARQCDRVAVLGEGKVLFQGDPEALTRRVEGRSWRLGGTIPSRRESLRLAMDHEEVLDAILTGNDVRFLCREGRKPPAPAELEAPEATLVPDPATFEDAFMDLLGGYHGGSSPLAERIAPTPPHEGPLIVAQGLTKRFGSFTAAREVDFQIGRGEVFGFLGPNGAGKSTVFKMLCGLLAPTEGTASILGIPFRRSSGKARSKVGYMAQKFSLYGGLGVLENLRFFAGVYGLKGKEREERIGEMVEVFGLEPYLAAPSESLPLGFKQRLALACAVLHRPTVLFLDEPTSGVDPLTRREFWSHINGMVGKGVSIMVTTHFMEEAEYCDKIALVYRGRIIATGSPDALKEEVEPGATMEEAFIELIRRRDREGEA